jgi:hypothetical protein
VVLQSLVDVYSFDPWEADEMQMLRYRCNLRKVAGERDGDEGAVGVNCGEAVISDWYWDMITYDWACDLHVFEEQFWDLDV